MHRNNAGSGDSRNDGGKNGEGKGLGRSPSYNSDTDATFSSSPSPSKVFGDSPPSWIAKKVVTHEAVSTYKFGR